MTKTAARILLGLPGLFILTTGIVFLTNPGAAADKLKFTVEGAEALSNMRGLFGGSVFAVGASLLLSAITAKLEYARPAAIFLLVLIGARVAAYLIDGPNDSIGLFVAVPTVAFVMMAAGHRLLDRAKAQAETSTRVVGA